MNTGKYILVLVICGLLLAPVSANHPPGHTSTIAAPTIDDPALGPGSLFATSFTISNSIDVFAWQLNITFNPAVLNVEGIAMGPYWNQVDHYFLAIVNNTMGTLVAAFTFVKSSTPGPTSLTKTSPESLVSVTWRAVSQGVTALHIVTRTEDPLVGTIIVDSTEIEPNLINYSTTDGYFSNIGCGTPPCPL